MYGDQFGEFVCGYWGLTGYREFEEMELGRGKEEEEGGCKLCTLSISGLCFSRKKWQKRQLEMRLRSQATP